MHGCCHKCGKTTAIIFLVLGVLFLLADLNVWTFFGETVKWWTVLFLLAGIIGLACSHCDDFCSMNNGGSMKKSKK